ncbi:hypothetical protein QVD17_16249 [Tagetes erecta]|uniref:Uncharacterized protein n=1 Tax=Tagetes erecta TaxID=13708 RepID=A0AAD8P0I7_TARER|nr:hypothetical protein QVD17_16249 [Tagetes erecta]
MAANVFAEAQESDAASTNPSASLTSAQYNELLKLLQHNVSLSQPAEQTNSINYANFADPFSEEASGSW